MDYSILPTLNTALNATTATLLVLGFRRIHRHRDEVGHRRMMIAATATSALFLISYVIYHAKVGSVAYTGEGVLRPIYFFLLITHIVLAAANVPLVILTLKNAYQDRRERHLFWAKITLPIWLYVSVTGIVVYLMLYVFSAAGDPGGP